MKSLRRKIAFILILLIQKLYPMQEMLFDAVVEMAKIKKEIELKKAQEKSQPMNLS